MGGSNGDRRDPWPAISEQAAITAPETEVEDRRIDLLTADVEDKFIYALFYEREQLNRRLTEKEKAFAEMEKESATSPSPSGILAAGRKEQEIDDLMKRVAQIESTIERLRETINAGVAGLRERLSRAGKSSALWFLSRKGRLRRMLGAELKTRSLLLDILEEKRPYNYFRMRRLGRIYLLIALTMVFTMIVSWQLFSYRYGHGPATAALSGTPAVIRQEDVLSLLEDIRKSNIEKDIGLWESRYSRQYLELPGKKSGVLDQWKNYDYRSLTYTVEDFAAGPDGASAVVSWRMELYSRSDKGVKGLTQRLHAEFALEDGKLKIRSVTKK